MIVKLYHRLARHAATANQLSQLQIALENRMTPLELAALTHDAGPYEPTASSATLPPLPFANGQRPDSYAGWCAQLAGLCEKSGKTVPEAFVRRRLHEKTYFFSGGESKQQKILFLCFSGGSRRMMMPLPVFLQHLDASMVDVILFTYPDHDGFRCGFANEENGLLRQISTYVDRKKYCGIVTMGTSGGGLPAVLVALGLGLDAALNVCGNDPYDLRWKTDDGRDAADLINGYTSAVDAKLPDLYLLYSETYTTDSNSAKYLSTLVNARHLAYNNPEFTNATGKPIRHIVLKPILLSGTLSSLLNATVFSKYAHTSTGNEEDWGKFTPVLEPALSVNYA